MILIKTKEKLNKFYTYGFGGYLNRNASESYLKKSTNLSDVKITETKTSFHFELKIPGYIKSDFNFYFGHDGRLVITTEKIKKSDVQGNEGLNTRGHSYCYASAYFKKHLQTPKNIIKEVILVEYSDETLSFDLPKIK